jgi:glycosyltransferase involved in cell wall biosynthesis/ADP-heptose:LPS heptosyltransferase
MRLVIDMQGAQTGSRFRGIGRYTMCLTKAILRNNLGHDIILALNGLFPDTIEAIRAEFGSLLSQQNIRVWKCVGPTNEANPSNRWRREVSERMREAFLLDLRPDVILITSLFEGLGDDAVGSVGLLHDSVPTAVILYDLIPLVSPDQYFQHSKIHIAWLRRKISYLKRSHRLLAISESSRQEALGELDFLQDEIVNISAACDESFRKLTISEAERLELCRRFGITKPFVMYTGGVDPSKNLPGLIRGFARLPDEVRAQHQLVFVGQIPEWARSDLSEIATNSGLSERDARFTGYVPDDDLAKLYNICSLFVFPSLHEGFGLPPLEAMSCGAAVIAANATSLPEVVGLTEAMFDPRSIEEIAAKIAKGLTDQAFRGRLLENGLEQVKKFSWDKSGRVALGVLADLAGVHRSRVSESLKVERTSVFERRRLRILVIKLDHLGDFILALPAIAKLRARYPDATIDAIVGSWNLEIARELGFFAEILTLDSLKPKSSKRPSAEDEGWETLLKRLARYDIAIDLRRQPEARDFLNRVKADLKVGYQTLDPSIDNGLDIALPTYRDVRYKRTRLNRTATSKQILALIDSLPSNENDFVYLPAFGAGVEIEEGAIAIFPRAGMDGREWGRANFEALVERLETCSDATRITVYFASQSEARGFNFTRQRKVTVQIGLKFADLARSLRTHALCVANNSGGAHLASLLNVGVIGVYSGHELASEWGPQFNESYVIHRDAVCAPCHFGRRSECPNGNFCTGDIAVDDVYGKIIEALCTRGSSPWKQSTNPYKRLVSVQRSTDSIVKELLAAIAEWVQKDDQKTLVEIAMALGENHPRYTISSDDRSIHSDVTVGHDSYLIDWDGFSGSEGKFRWTDGPKAAMEFYYDEAEGIRATGVLTLIFDTLGHQRIGVNLNGIKVADEACKGVKLKLELRVLNLKVGRNRLEFELPDAAIPANGDVRKLGIAVRSFTISAERAVRFLSGPEVRLGLRRELHQRK